MMKEERYILPSGTPLAPYPVIIRSCGQSRWESGASVCRQNALIFAIELITGGSMKFIQNGHEYLLFKGDCLIIHQRSFHQYMTSEKTGYVSKHFFSLFGDMVQSLDARLGLSDIDMFHPLPKEREYFETTFAKIMRDCKQMSPDYEHRLCTMAFDMLVWAGRCAGVSSGETSGSVHACINYMRQNLRSKITLNELQNITGTSRSGLFRLFETAKLDTPMGILRTMRMRHASALLQYTKKPLKEIATAVGYTEPSNFTAAFRSETKMSPRDFIRKYHGAGLPVDKLP